MVLKSRAARFNSHGSSCLLMFFDVQRTRSQSDDELRCSMTELNCLILNTRLVAYVGM